MRFLAFVGVCLGLAACGGEGGNETTPEPTGSGGTGGAGGMPAACETSDDGETLVLAAPSTVPASSEQTLCLRRTVTETLDITGFEGTLGPLGHHTLLLSVGQPTEPDGLAPCSEPEIMDAQEQGDFAMLAGVSYETDGLRYDFPASPVQVGLRVPAGSQLIFDAHYLNTGTDPVDACSRIELSRGKPVVAALEFRTILPEEQYGLEIPAMGSISVSYDQPAGARYRVAAASSHMHDGGTHFRMSVVETDQTLFETTDWAEPRPAIYDTQKIVVEAEQTIRLECSFDNPTPSVQRFPQQMCVGGMYTLACTLPGAC